MLRRAFLGIATSVLAFVCGCQKQADRREVAVGINEPTLTDPADRLRRHLEVALQSDGVSFDPFTISILVSVISGVLRFCLEANASRLQRAVQSRPTGRRAVALSQKLRAEYQKANQSGEVTLFRDESEIEQHVQSTMSAFIRATPEEFIGLMRDIQKTPVASIRFESQRLAREWGSI